MSLNQKKLTNILYKNNIPLVDFLLINISQEYNIPLSELEKRYKSPFERKQLRNTNKKGRMTGYSMFLKDIKVTDGSCNYSIATNREHILIEKFIREKLPKVYSR